MTEKGTLMTIFLLITVLAIVLLIIFNGQIRQQTQKHPWIRIVKYFILVPIAGFTVLSLILTIGEVAAGDLGGFSHLIPLIPLGIISYLLLRSSRIDRPINKVTKEN